MTGIMQLFEISNGWLGESYVRVIVIAENKEQALALAREAFKKDAEKDDRKELARLERIPERLREKPRLKGERYYTNLEITWSVDDLTKPYCSEPTDG